MDAFLKSDGAIVVHVSRVKVPECGGGGECGEEGAMLYKFAAHGYVLEHLDDSWVIGFDRSVCAGKMQEK